MSKYSATFLFLFIITAVLHGITFKLVDSYVWLISLTMFLSLLVSILYDVINHNIELKKKRDKQKAEEANLLENQLKRQKAIAKITPELLKAKSLPEDMSEKHLNYKIPSKKNKYERLIEDIQNGKI